MKKTAKRTMWNEFAKDYLSANLLATQEYQLNKKTLEQREDIIIKLMEKKWNITTHP